MSKPAKVYKMREEGKAKTLGNLIALLPSSDVDYSDLKTLVLQLITDTPSDSKETHYSSRARIKLDALRLLKKPTTRPEPELNLTLCVF